MRSCQNERLLSRYCPPTGALPSFWKEILYATLLLTILAGYSGQGELQVAPTSVSGVSQTSVSIVDYAFQPLHVNITTGTAVVWVYTPSGGSFHTVTSRSDPTLNTTQNGTPLLNSGQLNPGQSYSYTFYKPGFYPYECSFHPTILTMNSAWLNVTGPLISPPSTQGPTNVGTLLVIVGLGVGAAVAVTAVSLTLRRRIRKRPAAQAPG